MDLSDLSALLGEDLAATTAADVWVLFPAAAGATSSGDLALVSEARRLADGLGCYVHAVVTSADAAPPAIAAGADRVHVSADPAGYLAAQQPEFILLSSAHNALAAALAQRLQSGLITNVPGPVAVEPDTRALLGAHPVYSGEYFLDLEVTSPIKIATLDTARLSAHLADSSRTGEVLTADLPAPRPRGRDLGAAAYQPPAWRPLTKAHIIVAAGRGLHDQAGFELAAQLARALGAELAGDRSARDLGWIDEAHEVGVTAQEVAPAIYVAVGIAGDTIHNAAIAGARQVIAIHSNPHAPIFKVADLGLVADPKTVLPTLLAALAPLSR